MTNVFSSLTKNLSTSTVMVQVVLILITMTTIITFLPRDEKQSIHYDIDKPWLYGPFIAQFDFPVYKTEETLQREKDSVLMYFQPYFQLNPNIEKQMVTKFLHDYSNGLPGLPKEYTRIISNRMHRIYQAGIVSTRDYTNHYTDSTSMLRVIDGKGVESRIMTYLYSTRTAYEQLFIDDELGNLRLKLQDCNLNEYIAPNIIYDEQRTETERNELVSTIPQAIGMVIAGQKIIDRGDIVNEYTARVLESFDKENAKRNKDSKDMRNTLIGQCMYVFLMIFLFTGYLALFRKDYLEEPRSITMLYTLVAIFPLLVSFIMSHNFFSVYIIPFSIAPILARIFMDSRTAFITHVTMVLICAIAVKYQYEFLIIQLVSGLVAIHSLREMSQRSQILKTAFLVTAASCFIYFATQLMQNNDLLKMDIDMYAHLCVSGVLTLLSYVIMYPIEKLFGFTSDVTLFEISDTNQPALRDLSETCPGTFQHSITVSNLAAAIATRIGANSKLVRAGALYHDIGKMENPVYFTENQVGVNPHNDLTYTQSAQMIIHHVTDGSSMAEKYDLPQFIRDFILTHHGKGMAKYFYIKQTNEHPDEEVSVEQFTYPGPNPFTREQAILMMADSVEAASRSLNEYTEESIVTLVDRIIDGQVTEGFFKECPITFRDIEMAKQVLVERLKNIYHTRISYPKTPEEEAMDVEEMIEKTFEQNDKATD